MFKHSFFKMLIIYQVHPRPSLQQEFPLGMVLFSVVSAVYGVRCKVSGYKDDGRLILKVQVRI